MIINAGTYVDESVELAVEPAPTPEPSELPKAKKLPPRLETLIRDVAEAFSIEPASVLARDKRMKEKSRVAARGIVMWAIRKRWPLQPSYPEIGSLLGFDHTTIISAVNRIEAEIAKGSEVGRLALKITSPAPVVRLVAGSGAVFDGDD